MANEKSKDFTVVTSRVGTDNRVVFPKPVMDALALQFGDELVICIDGHTKEITVKRLQDVVDR